MWVRRSSSNWASRSAASSVSMRAIRSAISWSSRSSANSSWCSSPSSSKTSASSSGSCLTAAMISSPWPCGAASTRSASSAGWRRASFGCGTRSWIVGMWPVNGSTLAQSRKSETPTARGATARGSSRRSRLRGLDVDADDAPPAFDAGDLDLVRAHEPGAVDVDQLPVEQVFAQQQLAFAPLERLQVEPRLGEGDAAVLDLADLLGWDEDEPSGDLGDGAADRRVARPRRAGRRDPRSGRACGLRRRSAPRS